MAATFGELMRIPTIIALLIMAATSPAEEFRLHADVESGLREAIERGDMRAAVVGLYDRGATSTVTLGRVGADDDRKPDADTAFEIGSITKVFTSLLAEAQVEAGRIAWDDPVSRYLPDVEFASDAVAAITLRELASHTSGLPRIPDNMAMEDPLDPFNGYEDDDLLAYLGGMDTESLTREYAYSNLGAGLLGYLAAATAGESYAEAMRRDVLAPLGLDDTAVGLPPRLEERVAAGFSQGADMPNWSNFDALAGAGAIVSTLSDMLGFAEANLAGNERMDDALRAVRASQGSGKTGLGWHIHDVAEDDRVFWHNGGTGGYASFFAIRPTTQTAVVILTTSTEYALVTELGFEQIGVRDTAEATVDLGPYLGSYRLAEGFVLTVFEESNRLFGQATGQAAFPLTGKGPDEFEYPAADLRIIFDRSSPGPASALTLYQGGSTTVAPRVGDAQGPRQRTAMPVDPETLEDYVGRYRLTDEIVVAVMVRGEQLFAQVTGQMAYPVFAYEPDAFFYRVVDAQLHFERNEEGTVNAVVLHQGGEQRAPRIQ